MRWTTVAVLLLAACSSSRSGVPPGGDDVGGDDTGDDDPGPDVDAPPSEVRFVVMGDTGEGNQAQHTVAAAIDELCDREGCQFVFLLGDNIYDAGVESTDDTGWAERFEEPYAAIDLPFYAVLGNHDYGGDLFGFELGGLGNEWDKGPIEVEYTQVSEKWRMPATHYTLRFGPVGIIALDTNSILWGNTDHGDQYAWYPTALQEIAGVSWTFVMGHHPHRSNGDHGNAGNYDAPELEGWEVPNPLPIQNGDAMEAFYDDVVCGTADFLITGHDHSRQWLDEPEELCGAELIVSGAGAKTTEIHANGNQAFFEDASEPGFLYVVVDEDSVTGQFYDQDGSLDFERTVTH
jgi:predicted phosphodiesterase